MKERLQAWGKAKVIHVVGAFVFNELGEVLLLQRHLDDLGGGQWSTPGGRVDPGEDADTAIVRELYEETSIRSVAIVMLGSHLIRMPHGTVYMTSYRTLVPNDTGVVVDPEEHQAYTWLNLESLLDEDNIIWGMPSILRDFGLIGNFDKDPTLADGSSVELLESAK